MAKLALCCEPFLFGFKRPTFKLGYYEMRPSQLVPILAVPGTDEPVSLVVTKYGQDNEPHSGWTVDSRGDVIGRLNRFKFRFVDFHPVAKEEIERFKIYGPQPAYEFETEEVEVSDSRICYHGDWFEIGGYLKACNGDDLNCRATVKTSAPIVRIKFHAHGWSGGANVFVNGALFISVDLFNRETSIPRIVEIPNETGRPAEITISPTGNTNSLAKGRQILLEGIQLCGSKQTLAAYSPPAPVNKGGDFDSRFFRIVSAISALKPAPFILDIGGGKRSLDIPGYINIEYAAYDEPTMFGDALALPFKANSIDFAYTAAVLEHVKNPLLMGKEIYRVIKPGGMVLANSAFMQPVHSEGQHFFNCTPYGIELIFADFSDLKITWDGSISNMFYWMLSVAGVLNKLEKADLDSFHRLTNLFDKHLSNEGLMYVASGVWAEGKKPLSTVVNS